MANLKLFKNKPKFKKLAGPVKLDVLGMFIDEHDDATVFGVTNAGDQVDIAGAATIGLADSNPAACVSNVTGATTFHMQAVAVGHDDIGVTATWTDGSNGPYNETLPVDCKQDPNKVGGIIIVPGIPSN